MELNDFDDDHLDEIERLLDEAGERERWVPVPVPPFDPCLRRRISGRRRPACRRRPVR